MMTMNNLEQFVDFLQLFVFFFYTSCVRYLYANIFILSPWERSEVKRLQEKMKRKLERGEAFKRDISEKKVC